jgi:hypothetical protein
VELRREEGRDGAVFLPAAQIIVGAEDERADLIVRREPVAQPALIVPIVERDLRRDERENGGRVRVPPARERVAAAARERGLDERPRVDEAYVGVGAELP